jgi:hypothetical protein
VIIGGRGSQWGRLRRGIGMTLTAYQSSSRQLIGFCILRIRITELLLSRPPHAAREARLAVASRKFRFARDSPLEGSGFELVVPPWEASVPKRVASIPGHLDRSGGNDSGERGTNGSNPACSSGESAANSRQRSGASSDLQKVLSRRYREAAA